MKAFPLILGAAVLLVGGGVAMAASSPAVVQRPLTPPAQALAAIALGDPDAMQRVAISLQSSSTTIAAAMLTASQVVRGWSTLASDVNALAVGSIRTTDSKQILGVAAVFQSRGMNAIAQDLVKFAALVDWLKAGAAGTMAVATSPIATAIMNTPTPAATASTPAPGATPGATPTGLSTQVPAAVAQACAAAIATNDPAQMLALAKQLEAQFPQYAAALRAAAAAVQAAMQQGATGAATAGGPASAERVRAGKLVLALRSGTKGTSSEPRALVQQFQAAEGATKRDGSYGFETALILAERYGIVPPKPYYWGQKGGNYKTVQTEKAEYQSRIAALAAKDPQRADEWALASKV